MSDNGTQQPPQKIIEPEHKAQSAQPISVGYNDANPIRATKIRIEVDLDSITNNEIGSVLLRGYLDEIKEQILMIMLQKRQNRNRLITGIKLQ